MPPLRLGTRPSLLARRQTDLVADALRAAWPGLPVEVRVYATVGDRDLTHPLPDLGGKGVFTAELEDALSSGAIHLAVHSLKDLPITEGGCIGDLCIAAVMPREDPRDVLVSRHGLSLAELPPHPRIGTCSPRRAVQIRVLRPDAQIAPLRGNVDTRLRKAETDAFDAVVLAAAGLIRLGLENRVTEWLPFDAVLPAPGQGALALQCRAGDSMTAALLRPLHDPATWAAVTAERSFLAALDSGCSAPVAAYAEPRIRADGSSDLKLRGLIAAPLALACDQDLASPGAFPDAGAAHVIRVRVDGDLVEPQLLGWRAAQAALAQGAHEWLRASR